jgi:hypothetical protein
MDLDVHIIVYHGEKQQIVRAWTAGSARLAGRSPSHT